MTTPPDYIARDPAALTAELVASYETATDKTLYPAQPERLFINWLAWRLSLHREQIQDAAQLNLVSFSRGPALDALAEDRDDQRLPAFAAGAVIRFSRTTLATDPTLIPAGTQVASQDGAIVFATTDAVTLPASLSSVTVPARCTRPGIAGNGFVAGQIRDILSPIGAGITAGNTTTTADGAEQETDERLQARLLAAFDRYSVGGPQAAYRRLALDAHPGIIDVAVVRTNPGELTLYPLLDSGLPGDAAVRAVQDYVSDDSRRVLCDTVFATSPVAADYQISARLLPLPGIPVADAIAAATQAVQALVARLAGELGGDIVPSQFVSAMQPFAHRVELDLAYRACQRHEWRHCTGIEISELTP
ncbi:MAG: baseplate J/gp47 family protein [Laribacter sp.]|nr:baseplate J/gp47 family protein [Laribacter sp.]MBP9527580.1 baseplate J/gp47 family protein [Laribacter sp.]MBP9608539.1 baseplate J/gp47 family protein [Laribacter sp.]